MTTILRVLVVTSLFSTCIHACTVTKTTQEYIAGHCSHHNQSIPGITPLNQTYQITFPFVPTSPITASAHANHLKPQALWHIFKINILQDYLALYPDRDNAIFE